MRAIIPSPDLSPFIQIKNGLLNAKSLDQVGALATLYHITELTHEESNILLMLFHQQIDKVCEVRNYKLGVYMKDKLVT